MATKLPNHQTTRSDVFKELHDSEASYYRDLDYIDSYVLPGFAAALNVTEQNPLCLKIFGGIDRIKALSKQLCVGLDQQARKQDPCVSDLFISLSNEFVVYSERISNQPTAVKTYEDAIRNDSRLKDAMKIIFASKHARQRNYLDLFSLEYQRLCRYNLFLDRMVKVTDKSHPERDNLVLAQTKMNRIVMLVNEIKGEHERKQRLIKIADTIEFTGAYPAFPLVVPGRTVLYHGRLDKLRTFFNKPYYFFVFSDLIIYTLEVSSLFRASKYQVQGVVKLDQYANATSASNASPSKHYVSIYQGLQHVGKHYDALTQQNKQDFLQAFDEARTTWLVKFIQKSSKDRLQEKMERDRQACVLCSKVLSRFGRNRCPFCTKDVCTECFACTFSDRKCCVDCGKQRGVVAVDPRLVPNYRAYMCTQPPSSLSTTQRFTLTANMILVSPGDQLEAYYIVNQRFALGRNVTSGQIGCFSLNGTAINPKLDKGEKQNFALFGAIYDPEIIAPSLNQLTHQYNNQMKSASQLITTSPGGATSPLPTAEEKKLHTFAISLMPGDVILITFDNGDGWLFGMSLKTQKYGYVYYTALKIIRGTSVPKPKYQ